MISSEMSSFSRRSPMSWMVGWLVGLLGDSQSVLGSYVVS
jgi:hypothetical protein